MPTLGSLAVGGLRSRHAHSKHREARVFDGPYDVVVDELPTRAARRVDLVLGVWTPPNRHVVIAVDADGGELVRLPLASGADDPPTPLALAGDGRHLVATSRDVRGVYWVDVATGEYRLLAADRLPDESNSRAAVSPDGREIALLTDYSDPGYVRSDISYVGVSVVSVATGAHRRLWHDLGGRSGHHAVGWSPDQQLIAASYPQPDGETAATVILDRAGTVVRRFDDVAINPVSGAWVSDRELLCVPVYEDVYDTYDRVIVDVHDGSHRSTGGHPNAFARLGDRLIGHLSSDGPGPTRLASTDLDGSNPRLLITLQHPWALLFLDCAQTDLS
jgi:hypothetical protein